MKNIKIKLVSLILFPFSLLINYLFSRYPHMVDIYYSSGINKFFIQLISTITGVFPFSLFEVGLFTIVPLSVFYIFYSFIKICVDRKKRKVLIINFLLTISASFSVVYFLFLSTWGLNYNRPRLSQTINLTTKKYSTEELSELYAYLIHQVNTLSNYTIRSENDHMIIPGDNKKILTRAQLGYINAAEYFPNLAGNYGDPKPILASEFMNYTGIAGIYSPLTGEPNVNIALVDSSIPSTAMHEMAHQRGYANEDECNFIAFLTCSMHPDIDYKYSGYLLALNYTASALSKYDPNTLSVLNQNLSPRVRNDLSYHRNYNKKYEGKIETVSAKVNDTYLKANGIADGEKNYGKMVDLLLSYYQLYIRKETS